ncbi:tRNA pseudouridine(38-40) synthase TruA [Gelidibacter japonicus]|uniref:tRNA pseudouridine(38-40) synthase TruA n=1 Tax=Gelidibacter japonicus TaxID=1962232 RepID=UPI00202115E3|nr:tRNA pseudouridine(38-40) synthase TruA [Gelidibacter japonicus]MCL8008363.1 tRNA pseudouridine(38-40) synthase TruA [Gelidibacter japonicus]
MRYFIEFSYNGKAYHGWQKQPNAISVQQVLENALTTLLRAPVTVMGAGRTDAGVHAAQMYAHFDFEEPFDMDVLIYKINWFLPHDIAVHRVFEVQDKAHARFNALSRTYHYRISNIKNVFTHDFAYKIHLPLDMDKMNEACHILLQYKEFQCFSKSNTDVKTYFCDIKEAYWLIEGTELTFVVTADRFLRNMVRAIVGTMVNIGLGKLEVDQLHSIIQSKDRSEAGFSVPAHGLFLMNIQYPDTIFNTK